jgi:hypothetical protein
MILYHRPNLSSHNHHRRFILKEILTMEIQRIIQRSFQFLSHEQKAISMVTNIVLRRIFLILCNPSGPHYGPGVDSASKRNEYQESLIKNKETWG